MMATMATLDAETAARFQAGDLEALRRIVEFYQERLFRMGMKLLGGRDEADDFCQDTFLRIFEKRHGYDPSRLFEPWFFKVAVNVGREQLRRRREIPIGNNFPQDSVEAKGEQMLIKQEQQHQVQKALAQLKPKYRQSLALRFESDLSLKEIAGILGISLGTVKSRLSRGLQAFQKAYGNAGGE